MKRTIIAQSNALDLDQLKAPLVIRKTEKDGEIKYHGFVPGINKPDIVGSNLLIVKLKLNSEAKKTISNMIRNNKPFPFFPDKEAITRDFENVVYIKFLKLK